MRKGQINAFITCGKKNLQIAKLFVRSSTVIRNYLNNQENYGKNHEGGRQRVLSIRDRNHIIRMASNKVVSCGKIKTDLNLSASNSSILKCLNSVHFIANQKMKKKPMLTRQTQTED